MDSSRRRGPGGDARNTRKRAVADGDRLRLVSVGVEPASTIQPAAPVFPFRYFRIAISALKTAGALPHHIDRSVWSNKHFNLTDENLLPAFRFLGLIDEQRRPLPLLADLVASFDTHAWAQHLQVMLNGAYGDIVSVGIERASPKLILELFRKRFGLDAVRARVAAGFFVHAARESQIDVGPYLAAPQKQTSSGPKSRTTREGMTKLMLDRLPPFDETWNDELKLAWLSAFRDIVGSG